MHTHNQCRLFTYARTDMRIHANTNTHAHTYIHGGADRLPYTYRCRHTITHKHTYTHAHMHTHTCVHALIHTYIKCIHTISGAYNHGIHTHTHAYTQTPQIMIYCNTGRCHTVRLAYCHSHIHCHAYISDIHTNMNNTHTYTTAAIGPHNIQAYRHSRAGTRADTPTVMQAETQTHREHYIIY